MRNFNSLGGLIGRMPASRKKRSGFRLHTAHEVNCERRRMPASEWTCSRAARMPAGPVRYFAWNRYQFYGDTGRFWNADVELCKLIGHIYNFCGNASPKICYVNRKMTKNHGKHILCKLKYWFLAVFERILGCEKEIFFYMPKTRMKMVDIISEHAIDR